MSQGRPLLGRPVYLAFLPDFMFDADGNRPRYIVKAWLLALIPSILLSIVVSLLAPNAGPVEIPLRGEMLPLMILLLVVIGPLLETLLMTPVVIGVNRVAGPGPAVVANAVLWGVLHSLQRPIWGLVVWWPFLILSVALLTWRPRGIVTAMVLVTCIHGLQNSVTAAVLLFMDATGGAGST
jgi:membrane protease YdiL (CAAX protease family)